MEERKEKGRRRKGKRADDGENYSVPSVLRAVATRHTPRGLVRTEFLSPEPLGKIFYKT
jgi:hypothetical protein